MQKALIDSGIAEERTAFHPNALPFQHYIPCFEPGEYVLYAGRLSAEKGILTMLAAIDRKSTRLNSSHANISYAVLCLKKKKKHTQDNKPAHVRQSSEISPSQHT